jgi:hypothetical protein
MGLSSVAGIAFFITNDVRFVCWPFLLLILHFFHYEPSTRRIRNTLIVSLGLISLIKFTMLIVGVAVILALGAETVIKRKRFPWCLAIYAASLACFWLLAGQELSSFWPFVVNSWQVAAGYTEAMMSNGADDVKFAGLFLGVAAVVMIPTAFAAWKRLRISSVFAIGTLGFLTLIILKYGFVRDEHESEAALEMIAASLLCLAITWPVAHEGRWWWRVGIFLPIAVACLFAASSFQRFKKPSVVGEWAKTFAVSRWLAPIEQTYLSKQYREAWQQQLIGYRYQYSFPQVKGETDYYSERQIEVLANEVPYHPRPVPQSYCAYTPALAEMNAAHLRSERAPKFIVFDNFALDKRYRSLEDGLSWPELLTRYNVEKVELSYALLSRAKVPRKFSLVPLSDTMVKLGEPFTMPAVTNTPVWAEIEIDRTAAGSAISAMYKPPMVFLATTLRNGDLHTNSFLPGLGRAGFLLSPRVDESVWFAALGCTPWPRGLIGNEVTSFCIYPVANRFPVDCYKASVRVRLFRLEFPPERLENVLGLNRLTELYEIWRRNSAVKGVLLIDSADDGSFLSVPADSQIRLGAPEGFSHLNLGFGLSLDNDRNVPGITFRASALDKQQRRTTLWSRHIDSKGGDDRSRQTVSVDLGTNEISDVIIETIPDITNAAAKLAPYWYQIHFK